MNQTATSGRAWTAALACAMVFVLAMFLLSFIDPDISRLYYPWHIAEYRIQSTQWQIFFYAGFVMLVMLHLLQRISHPDGEVFGSLKETCVIPATVAFFFLAFMLCRFHHWFLPGFGLVLAVLWAGTRLSRPVRNKTAQRLLVAAVATLAGLFFLVFYLVPLFFPLFVADKAFLSNLELHYAMTVLPGFELGRGVQDGLIGKQYYGFSMPLLMAGASGLTGFIDTAWTRLIVSVKLLQLVAAGLLLWNLYLLNRRHFLLLCMVTFCMVSALTTIGTPVYFPNQAGVRYVPLLLGLLFLTSQRNRKHPNPLLFAIVSGVLIAANPETGLTFFCGSMLYLAVTAMNAKGRLLPAVTVVAKAGLLALICFAVSYKGLSLVLVKSAQPEFFSNLRTFALGFGGTMSQPHIMAALVFLVGMHTLYRGFLKAGQRLLTPVDAYQTAVGGIMVAWLLYYVAREDEWNLWFQSVLLIVCIAPRLKNPLRFLSRRRSPAAVAVAATLVLAFTASAVTSVMYNRSYLEHIRFFASLPGVFTAFPRQEALYFFHQEDRADYETKMRYLDAIVEKSDYLVLSNLPVSVRMHGFNSNFPWYDLFGEINAPAKFDAFVAWMHAFGPRYLVLDDGASDLSAKTPNHDAHYRYFLESLAEYTEVGRESGWVVYARTGS
jgi:hypothetical protein